MHSRLLAEDDDVKLTIVVGTRCTTLLLLVNLDMLNVVGVVVGRKVVDVGIFVVVDLAAAVKSRISDR